MHRFFIEEDYNGKMTLTGPVAHHIQDVLRMQVGEALELVCDNGVIAAMRIESMLPGKVNVVTEKILQEPHESQVEVTLAQGLAKGDKMDLVVQKAVELGVSTIVPLALSHSVVRLTGDKAAKKQERWQKIALAAAQQSKRDRVPVVTKVQSLTEVLQGDYDVVLLAYEGETKTTLKDVLCGQKFAKILVIIGPEGGLAEDEVQTALTAGARSISLGRRILRSETAGLVVLSCIFYEYEE